MNDLPFRSGKPKPKSPKSPKSESFDDEIPILVPQSPKLELYENEFVPLQPPTLMYRDNTVNKLF